MSLRHGRITVRTAMIFVAWLSVHLALWRIGLLLELAPVTLTLTVIWKLRHVEQYRISMSAGLSLVVSIFAAVVIAAVEIMFVSPAGSVVLDPRNLAGGIVYAPFVSLVTVLCWELETSPY